MNNNISNVAGYIYKLIDDEYYVYVHLRNSKISHGNNIAAPGGKIEKNDKLPINALVREFKEECGIITSTNNWKEFLQLNKTVMYCKDYTNKKLKFIDKTPSHNFEVEDIKKLKEKFNNDSYLIESKYNHAWIELKSLKEWLEKNQNIFYRPIQVLYYKLYIQKHI